MSTNFTIAIVNWDDTVSGIYGHWDGHVETAGRTLVEHYNDEVAIRELISQGNVSSLADNLKESVFYGRDRGEDVRIYHEDYYEDFIENHGQEYNYLYIDGVWIWDQDEVAETLKERGVSFLSQEIDE